MQKLLLISVTDQSASVVIKNPWKYQTRGWNGLNQEKVVGVPAGKPPAQSRQHRAAGACGSDSEWSPGSSWQCGTRLLAAKPNQELQRGVSKETITSLVFIHVVLEEAFKNNSGIGGPMLISVTLFISHTSIGGWVTRAVTVYSLQRQIEVFLSNPWRDHPVPTSCSQLWPLPPGTHFSSRRRFF